MMIDSMRTFRRPLVFLLAATALYAADFRPGGRHHRWRHDPRHDGRAERVRLWGIDCPERGQSFGTRARQFTGDLAFGKDVKVIVRDVDRYGRTVGEVILPGGRNLNQELVRAGLAWWYVQFAPRDRVLAALQTEARDAKRGLWADKNPVPPWEWRRAPAAVR